VVCPANLKSGGPELLHQLVFSLNKQGAEAHIVYTNIKSGQDPTPTDFDSYISSYKLFTEIPDIPGSVIILPETRIDLLKKFKHTDVYIWWMSIDNYLDVYSPKRIYKQFGVKSVLSYLLRAKWRFAIPFLKKQSIHHLAQSQYAIDFLTERHITNVRYLSDYVNRSYVDASAQTVINNQRNNVVLYNPKKGLAFTERLIQAEPDITWVPLINLTTSEVKQKLLTSKVYVDFGSHPGKDRFPREAAILGCCIITGKRGSARNSVDIPIPDTYKFDDQTESIDVIIKRIKFCLDDFESASDSFRKYRRIIANEYTRFNQDVSNIFLQN
jgi:hypothetical protein